jgi:phosphopantothenoylcysteine decarboxylase/phosphopantothenate--cysteine ligase
MSSLFAPAMDLDMYKHPSTIASFTALQSFGNHIIQLNLVNLLSGLSAKVEWQNQNYRVS